MHQKMVKSHHDMCEECQPSDLGFQKKSRNFVFSKVERIVVVHSEDGEDEVILKCSCCGVNFERKFVDDSSCFVIHPLWDILGDIKKGNSVDDHAFKIVSDDHIDSDCVEEHEREKEELETEESEMELIRDSSSLQQDLIQFEQGEEDLHSHDLQFFIDYSGNQLFPFEMPDSKTEEHPQDPENEDHEFGDFQKAQTNSQDSYDSVHLKTEESHNLEENLIDFGDEQVDIDQETQNPATETKELQEEDSGVHSVHEEEDVVSIGAEIPVLDSCDEIKAQDNFTLYSLSHEEPSTSSHDLDFNLEYEAQEDEKTGEMMSLDQLDPTSIMIERHGSTVEESFDGSEMDGGDPITTTEKLRLALRAERKALQALYMELEEERSASEVAASETMAMINRLQEEKAAMQMEALQYQRMMEEQSEYDQEALQLLNELMVKKDKELEIYRKKVMDYETKERIRFLSGSVRSGTCSASCSHSEDGDGTWVDPNDDPKEEEHSNGNRESRLHVPNLDSSFVDFEDKRLSILEQLKVLEEKLFALSDEEDRHFSGASQIEDYFEENGKNHGHHRQEINGIMNGEPHYQDRRSNGLTGKRLLPLFDALDDETEEDMVTSNGHENGTHPNKLEDNAVTRFELQKKRIDMEEEVDQLYVRLQALEADREFLKHCIGSLRKGDKGMELLQEILQHLRDLRSVDLRAKNLTDDTLV